MNIEQAQKRIARLLGNYREELAEIERSLTNRQNLPDAYRMERRFRFNFVLGAINGVTEAKEMLEEQDAEIKRLKARLESDAAIVAWKAKRKSNQ